MSLDPFRSHSHHLPSHGLTPVLTLQDKLKFWWAYQRVWPFYLAGYLYEWWSELRNKADKKDELHAIIKAKKTLRTEGEPNLTDMRRGYVVCMQV